MITIVLAEPENAGNVGAVCRVMENFGFTRLVLINPRCKLDQQARNLAKNAQRTLENAEIATWEILDTFSLIVATAGKKTTDKNLLRSPLTPREAAEKIAGVQNVAILFGRESDGLRNAELARADFVIQIPTTRAYPSMNLSHSVAVVLYELFLVRGAERFTPVPAAQKQVLYARMDELIDTITFPTEGKKETQHKIWKSILGRAVFTKMEAQCALGFFRAIERQRNQSPKAATRSAPAKQPPRRKATKPRRG